MLRLKVQYALLKAFGIPFDADFRFLSGFQPRPGEIFADVGANRGQSALCMRHYHPEVSIVSFEPLRPTFEILRSETRKLAHYTAHNVALGDAPGTLPIFVPTYDGQPIDVLASTVREEAENWLEHFLGDVLDTSKIGLLDETAEIATLDSYDLAPAFLKMDVQGAEDRVLRGGMTTLERHKPVILLEKSDGLDLTPLLAPLGYAEYHFRNGQMLPGTASGANAFFIPPERHDTLSIVA